MKNSVFKKDIKYKIKEIEDLIDNLQTSKDVNNIQKQLDELLVLLDNYVLSDKSKHVSTYEELNKKILIKKDIILRKEIIGESFSPTKKRKYNKFLWLNNRPSLP